MSRPFNCSSNAEGASFHQVGTLSHKVGCRHGVEVVVGLSVPCLVFIIDADLDLIEKIFVLADNSLDLGSAPKAEKDRRLLIWFPRMRRDMAQYRANKTWPIICILPLELLGLFLDNPMRPVRWTLVLAHSLLVFILPSRLEPLIDSRTGHPSDAS